MYQANSLQYYTWLYYVTVYPNCMLFICFQIMKKDSHDMLALAHSSQDFAIDKHSLKYCGVIIVGLRNIEISVYVSGQSVLI